MKTKISSKVKVHNTKKYGKGIFATRKIRKGELIATFDGHIYDDHFDGWTEEILNHVIQFDKTKWRDSRGLARFINHSCEPNCGIRGLFDVVAMQTIEEGEQITWDYEMTERNTWGWKMKCKCGNLSCRKVIGNFDNMPLTTRKKYKGYISQWLTKER